MRQESESQLGTRLRKLVARSPRLKKESEKSVCKQYVTALKSEISSVLANSTFKDLEAVIKAAERVEIQLAKNEQAMIPNFVNAIVTSYPGIYTGN